MPVTLSVDHVRKTATATAIGPIAIGDVREHLDAERIRGGLPYREFIDATRATAAISAADAQSIVETLRRLGRKGALGPTAVLVSNDVTYGMLRMIETLVGDVAAVRPFRERAEAEKWLAAAPIRGGETHDA